VELEGEALLTLNKQNTVIALTGKYPEKSEKAEFEGSNPLHEKSMLFLRPKGIVVYIDVPSEDILKRLEIMKVDRIVGQGTKSLGDVKHTK
jgi:shikimate kinase